MNRIAVLLQMFVYFFWWQLNFSFQIKYSHRIPFSPPRVHCNQIPFLIKWWCSELLATCPISQTSNQWSIFEYQLHVESSLRSTNQHSRGKKGGVLPLKVQLKFHSLEGYDPEWKSFERRRDDNLRVVISFVARSTCWIRPSSLSSRDCLLSGVIRLIILHYRRLALHFTAQKTLFCEGSTLWHKGRRGGATWCAGKWNN